MLKQLVAMALLSALISVVAMGIEILIGGLELPAEQLFPFLWLACACMMAPIVALCDLALPLGALVGVTTFSLGMSCAMLAYEMLPQFWQEWVYPWVPQRYLGDGIRAIVYRGADALSGSLWYWLVLAAIGVVASSPQARNRDQLALTPRRMHRARPEPPMTPLTAPRHSPPTDRASENPRPSP